MQIMKVMAIIDDKESRGFMFKYDKLFGINPLSDADIKNQNEGKETSIDRPKDYFMLFAQGQKKVLQ